MEAIPLVRNFLKLQKALKKIEENGMRLGSIKTEGEFDYKHYTSNTYSDKEHLLADAVKELNGSFSEKNVFCCGGLVKLPEHDQKFLIVKLLDGDPQSCTPESSTEVGQSGEFDRLVRIEVLLTSKAL